MIIISIENIIENCIILALFALAYVIITAGIATLTTPMIKRTKAAWIIGCILYIVTVAAFLFVL